MDDSSGRGHAYLRCFRVRNRLGAMRNHAGEHAAHMLVGGRVKHLLAVPLRPQDAAGAQQAQMMADQRLREMAARRDVRHAAGLLKADHYDLEPARLAQDSEQVGELENLIVGECQKTLLSHE
jgi:hypothetical protein